MDLDGLKSAPPSTWKEEAPSNQMRLAQFKLPKVKGDADDAELVIFKNAGGNVRDNVTRWKGQFTPPEGKAIDDVAKVTEIKIGGRDATLLDIHGTYLYKRRPFDPAERGEKRPDGGYKLPGPLPRIGNKSSTKNKDVDADFHTFEYSAVAVEAHTTRAGFLFYDVQGLANPLVGAKLNLRVLRNAEGKELFYFEIPFDKYLATQGATAGN